MAKTGSSTNISFFFRILALNCVILVPLIFSFFDKSDFTDIPDSPLKINFYRIISSLLFLMCSIFFSLPVVFAVNSFGYVDFAKVFCSITGLVFYFLLCSSFTVLIFSTVGNRGIGFALSVIFLLCLNYLFFTKFSSFSKGILIFKDICFFLIFSFAFLFAGDLIVRCRYGFYLKKSRVQIILFVLFIILSLIFSSIWNFRIDLSAAKKNSISKCTKELFASAEFPVELTYYYSPQLKKIYPETSDTLEFLKEIGKLKNARVKILKVRPDSELEHKLQSSGISGQNVQTGESNSVTYTKVFAALSVNYGGIEDFIPFAIDSVTLEYNLDLKLAQYFSGKQMNVALVCANNLSLDNDYSYLTAFLEASGLLIRKVQLPLNQMSFLPGETIFLIGSQNLSSSDAEIIEQKLFSGYKAFICTSRNSVDFSTWQVTQKNDPIIKMLGSFGLVSGNDLIESKNCHKMNFFSKNGTDVELIDYSLWPLITTEKKSLHVKNSFVSVWPGYFNIYEDSDINKNNSITPVLFTSENSWIQHKFQDQYEVNPFILQQLTHNSQEEGQFTVGADLKGTFYGYRTLGSGNIDIKVFADQYIFSNNILNIISGGGIPDTGSLTFAVDSILELKGLSELSKVHNKSNFPEYVYKESKYKYFPTVYIWCCIFVILCWSILLTLSVLIRKIQNKRIYSLIEVQMEKYK